MTRAYLSIEPADQGEAMERIALLRTEVTQITEDLRDPWQQATRGERYEDWRRRAIDARYHKEREIASLKAWLRKAGHEAHEERKAWRRALVAAQPALRAIVTSTEAMGGDGLVWVTPEQLAALKSLLLPEEGLAND